MAMQITNKDRLFVMVALPVAVVCCYAHFIRRPLSAEATRIKAQIESTGDADDLMRRRRLLENRLAEVRALYDAEVAKPSVTNRTYQIEDNVSMRLRSAIALFEECGAMVISSTDNSASTGTYNVSSNGSRISDMIANVHPGYRAQKWTFVLDSTYNATVDALNRFTELNSFAVVESIKMLPVKSSRNCRWSVTLWL